MYIETVPNRSSPPAVLLREARREGKKIVKRTLANLSRWPREQVEALRLLLRGERLIPAGELFRIERTLPHGHVEAILRMIAKLGLDTVIGSKRCRERDLILAMIVERLIHPRSKLANTRHWNDTTLSEELSLVDADVDELYDALDWLLARQSRIEKKLASRHLEEGGLVLYDVSSSYYEGHTCPLAHRGHDRDGRKGLPIIVYGVMTDRRGCPVAVQVYPGNTGDPTTIPDQVDKLRCKFNLSRVVMVADRGMLTQPQIDHLKNHPGLGWISALRSGSIRELMDLGHLQRSLFDRQNLAEIHSPEFPGERLMACYNPLLADRRARQREELLAATETKLKALAGEVAKRKRKILSKDQIGVKLGRTIARYKMAKHFEWTIEEGEFHWHRCEESIRAEAEMDGIYVVRTSELQARLSAEDTVRSYKSLAQVERVFRCMKGNDLRVRPIYHRTQDRVRAHIFLCVLAYYVEWHLRAAWGPLLFQDEELPSARQTRDAVAPAQSSVQAKNKKNDRQTPEGLPIQSFETLLAHLASRTRNLCRLSSQPTGESLTQITEPTPLQTRATELLDLYPGEGN
jgi:transposase